eukprot:g33779.t1
MSDYLKVLGLQFREAGACGKTWEEHIAKVRHNLAYGTTAPSPLGLEGAAVVFVKVRPEQLYDIVLCVEQAGPRYKELTSSICCRLAHSRVQDYVLKDKLKIGAATAKVQRGKTAMSG